MEKYHVNNNSRTPMIIIVNQKIQEKKVFNRLYVYLFLCQTFKTFMQTFGTQQHKIYNNSKVK